MLKVVLCSNLFFGLAGAGYLAICDGLKGRLDARVGKEKAKMEGKGGTGHWPGGLVTKRESL